MRRLLAALVVSLPACAGGEPAPAHAHAPAPVPEAPRDAASAPIAVAPSPRPDPAPPAPVPPPAESAAPPAKDCTPKRGRTLPAAASARFTSCATDADCELVPMGCCGPCGEGDAAGYVAIASRAAERHHDAVCAGGVACPACVGSPPHDVAPVCVAKQCRMARYERPAGCPPVERSLMD